MQILSISFNMRKVVIFKLITIIVAVTFYSLMQPINSAKADIKSVENFINDTAKLVLNIINSNEVETLKAQKLKQLFQATVDIDWMAKFALARVWRQLNTEQQYNYLNAYRDYLTQSYVSKFREYNGQEFTISLVKALDNNQYIVMTSMVSNSGSNNKLNVSYRCKEYSDGKIKIIDIIGENISLLTTQRSEFSSIIARESIEALIEILKSKVTSN